MSNPRWSRCLLAALLAGGELGAGAAWAGNIGAAPTANAAIPQVPANVAPPASSLVPLAAAALLPAPTAFQAQAPSLPASPLPSLPASPLAAAALEPSAFQGIARTAPGGTPGDSESSSDLQRLGGYFDGQGEAGALSAVVSAPTAPRGLAARLFQRLGRGLALLSSLVSPARPVPISGLARGLHAAPAVSAPLPRATLAPLPEIQSLNALGKIRVYFAAAPGFGHQSATLSVVRRLRDLGYTGEVDAVYEDNKNASGHGAHYGTVRQKLAALLPDFKPEEPGAQAIAEPRMTVRPYVLSEAQADPVALGLTGGWDRWDERADAGRLFGAEKFLHLGPMDWEGYKDALWKDGTGRPIKDNDLRALIYEPVADAAVDDAYFARLDTAKYGAEKIRGLAALARQSRGRDVMPLYGLAFMDGKMVYRLTRAVAEAFRARPKLFKKKGIVLPVLLDVPQVMDAFELELGAAGNEALRRRVQVADIADPDIEDRLARLAADEILVLKTGPVPPAVFEWLFRRATLPPTLEGKNAMNLARLLGTPYIPVTTHSLGDLDMHISRAPAQARARAIIKGHFRRVAPTLRGDEPEISALTSYIVDAMTPGSALRGLFESARIRQDDYSRDKTVAALREAMKP